MTDILGQECAVLRPGDRLIVRIDPDRATLDLVEEFRARLAEHFPDDQVVVIAADQIVVRPKGDGDD